MTGDVTSVPTVLLGTPILMQTICFTDYISITSSFFVVAGIKIPVLTNRYCGLGFGPIFSTSFQVQVITNANETPDHGNRGFYLNFVQG